MKVRVHKILKHTKTEGPGNRYCIWFQGCSRHCPGCWAKATWNHNDGTEYDTEELLNDILASKNIEGVTFLGGEPFEQANALAELTKNVKNAGLSVVCFTGNKFDVIKKKFPEILKYTDILIDGEFKEDEKDFTRPWVGSKNQNYYFLTDIYDKNILNLYKNKIEINIDKNGMIFVNGMGDFEKFTRNLNMLIKH